MRFARVVCVLLLALPVFADDAALQTFRREIEPILQRHCFDCHGDGIDKGGVTLDSFETSAALHDHELWERVLRNVRGGVMPPIAEENPVPPEQAAKIVDWIKRGPFALDPAKPDPGRVTIRRLNRVEYRNTIRDLTGVEYDTEKEFPADDTGHGFDNIADVLTVSPMLLEKYLDAAQAIVAKGVVTEPRTMAEARIAGREFEIVSGASESGPVPAAVTLAANVTRPESPRDDATRAAPVSVRPPPAVEGSGLVLSYYTPAVVRVARRVARGGEYEIALALSSHETYVDDEFDLNKCRVRFSIDGDVVLEQAFVREGAKTFDFVFLRELSAGEHSFALEVEPLEPTMPQHRNLRLRVQSLVLRGPRAPEHWVETPGYADYFPREVPASAAERRAYAREILAKFATRAFRRPPDAVRLDRLVELAESVNSLPENRFESGVAQAMVAVLASPSFLFREDFTEPLQPGEVHPAIDEYSLASRLSYFLWSSMPDEELLRLAGEKRLRANLHAQVARMLRDERSREFVRNFTGQWLQARDIDTVAITEDAVYLREHPNPAIDVAREIFRRLQGIPDAQRTEADRAALEEARRTYRAFMRLPKPQLTSALRRAMREETERVFAHILDEDRSVLELLESDYTFLNEPLAKHYGIEGVTGAEMRKVTLPPGSPRGGVLTQGTVLTVTSNPTRTSPVKRGVFVLEAILGLPPAPPPPNIPALEDAAPAAELRQMSLRETLALHASNAMCASCHSRMDPLGLALENFNAMGIWRTSEMNQPVQPAGRLVTGESFADIRELKRILVTSRRHDFYHSLSEKLLTYALGRSVEYYDTITLDRLAEALEHSGGKLSALIYGIVDSPAFQRRRAAEIRALLTNKDPRRRSGAQPLAHSADLP